MMVFQIFCLKQAVKNCGDCSLVLVYDCLCICLYVCLYLSSLEKPIVGIFRIYLPDNADLKLMFHTD